MTTIVSPAPAARTDVFDAATGEQRLLLDNITWQQYLTISDALPDRGGLRLTYDRGRLEFMTTSPLHERYKVWFGRFFDILAEEAGVPTVPAGQSTFAGRSGAWNSICYWIAHDWCFDGKRIQVRVLTAGETYETVERSPTFPSVSVADVVPFFGLTETQDSLTVIREFRAWVREQLARK